MNKKTQEIKLKPRVFIGSSVESLSIANSIQILLEHNAEVTVWTQGVFEPSNSTLEDLLELLDNIDFGVFVFSDDDVARIRKKQYTITRDNVIFEMGMFIGRLGKKRTFYILPRKKEKFHLPTDLIGVNPLDYDNERSDKNLTAALGVPCAKIVERMNQLGRIEKNDNEIKSLDTYTSSMFTLQEEAEFKHIFSKINKSFSFICPINKQTQTNGKEKTQNVGYAKLTGSFIKCLSSNILQGNNSIGGYRNSHYFFYSFKDALKKLVQINLPKNENFTVIEMFDFEESPIPSLKISDLIELDVDSKFGLTYYSYTKKCLRFISWLEYYDIGIEEPQFEFIEFIQKK